MRDKVHRFLDRSVVWNSFSVLCLVAMLMFLGLRMRQEYRHDQAAEAKRLTQVQAEATAAAEVASKAAGVLDARTPLFANLNAELHRTRAEVVEVRRLLNAERARAATRQRQRGR